MAAVLCDRCATPIVFMFTHGMQQQIPVRVDGAGVPIQNQDGNLVACGEGIRNGVRVVTVCVSPPPDRSQLDMFGSGDDRPRWMPHFAECEKRTPRTQLRAIDGGK